MGNFDDGMLGKICRYDRRCKCGAESFADLTQTTWDIKGFSIPIPVLLSVIVAWAAIYYCIRNGASSVGKVVKYTVFLPVILLVIMAIKGCTMSGAGEGLRMFSFQA